MAKRDSQPRMRVPIIAILVVVVMSAGVGLLAFADRDNIGKPAPRPSSSSGNFVTTTKTYKPGPPQDESVYFAAMRKNWESTWVKSGEAVNSAVCKQWDVDPLSMIQNADVPPDIPRNIEIKAYKFRLGDFFMEKCGTPHPTASPTPSNG